MREPISGEVLHGTSRAERFHAAEARLRRVTHLMDELVPIPGTVLGDLLADTPLGRIDDIEFVRTVAVARILMPRSVVRLSAGREGMSESTQALCFLAGANSIFTGEKLLTAPNAGGSADSALFAKLGLRAATGAGAPAGPPQTGTPAQ